MRSYNWWQARLATEFFGPERAGRPLLFFIDDEKAADLHRDAPPNGGVSDLCTAVADEVIDWLGDAYRQAFSAVLAWKRSSREDPPPCLPLLAVSVLAATRMRGSGGRGAHSYYARLAELLSPPSWFNRDRCEKHLQDDYSTVVDLWMYLDEWLKEQGGTRGHSTLHVSKGRERIGYAQSQALICAADQDRLLPFLRERRGRDATVLLRELRNFGEGDRLRLSKRLREALHKHSKQSEEDSLLGSLLVSLAEATDRVPPVPSRLQHLQLRVTATENRREGRWALRWRAERVPGISEDNLPHRDGHLALGAQGDGALYTLSGALPDLGQALENGLVAWGKHLGVSLQPRRNPLILQEDPLGGWTEVDKPEPCLPALILFNERSEGEARKLVDQAGFSWEEPEETSVDGWFVAADVEFTEGLSGASRPARLAGGLHVRLTRERRHYFLGGEPDLVPPPGVDVVRLDGVPIHTAGQRVELRGRGLSSGKHVIDSGAGQLSFYLHPPREWIVPEMALGMTDPDSPVVQGSTVIDAEGRHTDLIAGGPPKWWHERQTGLSGGPERIEIPDSAVWLVIDHPDGTIQVRLLRPEEPRITNVTTAMRKFWRQMFAIEHPPPEKLWRRYWQAVLGRGNGNS
ncbi:hypothetical protein F5972_27495 [Microbispora cellulosiformans]|uniref:Uncharacterized protein n=1 Tax=Microbispora cellulosiformans TaxID=2614688 RepID=A0A5J5JVG6_9ACTN|nr:hypothetical protein [Microbispora cellulosiformans]KAA9375498.1 hypothetical protein F5972_27495 [Microbispora cellulosiformans]